MNAKALLDTLVANLPLLLALAGSVGLLSFLAGHIRRGVVEARKAAKATPTKIDDFVVDVIDGPLLEAADLLERGDLDGAKRKLVVVRSLLKPKKGA